MELWLALDDQMKVLSNGQYKNVLHRATFYGDKRRFF